MRETKKEMTRGMESTARYQHTGTPRRSAEERVKEWVSEGESQPGVRLIQFTMYFNID